LGPVLRQTEVKENTANAAFGTNLQTSSGFKLPMNHWTRKVTIRTPPTHDVITITIRRNVNPGGVISSLIARSNLAYPLVA
jgi:hypothetical protein